MTIPSFIITLILFLLTGLIILRPVLVESDQNQKISDEKDFLLAERERLFSAILDLDQDHDLQKISDQEYTTRRKILQRQAADVLMRIDQLSGVGLNGETRARPD
jgi:hypothetical protein